MVGGALKFENWITCSDPGIRFVKHPGSGGYGDVSKVSIVQ
jgi:hypothetical protein